MLIAIIAATICAGVVGLYLLADYIIPNDDEL